MDTQSRPRLKPSRERTRKLFCVLGLLFLYRLASNLRVPWINVDLLEERLHPSTAGSSMLMASDFWRFGLVMLGVSPYILAASLLSLGSLVFPGLERLHKSGPLGVAKLARWTVILSIVLATFSALSIVWLLQRSDVLFDSGPSTTFIIVLTMVAGYSFVLFLISRLSLHGLGSGLGLIILASTLTQLPRAIFIIIGRSETGSGTEMLVPSLLLFLLLECCILFRDLFGGHEIVIASIAFAVTLIDSITLVGRPISDSEPEFVRLTREALGSGQPLRYVLLFLLIVGIWTMLRSEIFRKKADRLRSNAMEVIAGVALGFLVTTSDILLSGVNFSRLPMWLAPTSTPRFLVEGYAPFGPNGACFVISVFACMEVGKAYPSTANRVAAIFRRFRREKVQPNTGT